MNGSTPKVTSHYNLKISNQVLNDFYANPLRAVVDPRLLANIPLRGNEPPLPKNEPWRLLSVHRKLWHFSDQQMVDCLEALKFYYTNHKRSKNARTERERLLCQLVPVLIEYYAAVCLELKQERIDEIRDRYLSLISEEYSPALLRPDEIRRFIDQVFFEQQHQPQVMTYAELEKLCTAAFGAQWQKGAAEFFGISKATVSAWKTRERLPDWVAYCRTDLLGRLRMLQESISTVLREGMAKVDPESPELSVPQTPDSVDDIFE